MQLKHECHVVKFKHMKLHATHFQKYKISIFLWPINWRLIIDIDQRGNEKK